MPVMSANSMSMSVALYDVSMILIVAMFVPMIEFRARMMVFVNNVYPLMRVSMSSKWIPKLFPGDSICRSGEQQ